MKNKVILCTSNVIGKGDENLGETIVETFFTLLKQREELPHSIFLMNRGVFLATDQSLASVHLHELAQKGVHVLACSTCLQHYQLEDALVAGQVSTMGQFLELATEYQVITL